MHPVVRKGPTCSPTKGLDAWSKPMDISLTAPSPCWFGPTKTAGGSAMARSKHDFYTTIMVPYLPPCPPPRRLLETAPPHTHLAALALVLLKGVRGQGAQLLDAPAANRAKHRQVKAGAGPSKGRSKRGG